MQSCLDDNHLSTQALMQKFMNYNMHNLLQILPDLTEEQQEKFSRYLDN
jgi:hypothetical protein